MTAHQKICFILVVIFFIMNFSCSNKLDERKALLGVISEMDKAENPASDEDIQALINNDANMINPASTKEEVIEYLLSDNWFLISNAIIIASRNNYQEAVPYIKELLNHNDPDVRAICVRALANLLQNGAENSIRNLQYDNNTMVSSTAEYMLEYIKNN